MTKRLYHEDAYLTAFDARVVDCRSQEDAFWLSLDQSAFYPTSGGQPHDTGTLTADGRALDVTDVTVDDQGVMWHRVAESLIPGTAVTGQIDWPRRFDHMQQHAGEHIMAGCLHQLYGGFTHGLHIGQAFNTIDVTMPDGRLRLTDTEITQLETLANQRIQQDAAMRAWFPPAEEMAALPLRKEPTVESHVRVVAAGEHDLWAEPAVSGAPGEGRDGDGPRGA